METNTNQKKMELTKREKNLLIILAVVIVFVIFSKFIFSPQRDKINSLEGKKSEYKEELTKINGVLAKEDEILEKITKLNEEKLSMDYFSSMEQQEILYILNKRADDSNLKLLNMDFEEVETEDMSDLPIKAMDISLSYECKYEELIDFLGKVRTNPGKLFIVSLSVDSNNNNGVIGAINFRAYKLVASIPREENIIDIPDVLNNEKINPFVPFGKISNR